MNSFIKILITVVGVIAFSLFAQPKDSADIKKSGIESLQPFYLLGSIIDVYLNSYPQDAYVYKGDSLIGHTPLFLAKTNGFIQLEKPGYKKVTYDLFSSKTNAIVRLESDYPVNQQKFYTTPVFKIILGSVAALGVITTYLKLKADRHYDNYLKTGDNNELDRTRKYDLFSGLSFGALQINLGVLIYYFLND